MDIHIQVDAEVSDAKRGVSIHSNHVLIKPRCRLGLTKSTVMGNHGSWILNKTYALSRKERKIAMALIWLKH